MYMHWLKEISWGLSRGEELLSLSINTSLRMNKQISFMIISAIMLTASVTIVLYTGSETAQAAGANMTNATAAAGANMTQPK